MLEVLFVLVIVFVAYVLCCALSHTPTTQSVTPITETKLDEVVAENTNSEQSKPKPPKPSETKPEKVVKPVTTKTTDQKKGLKNPNTGEIATSYSNYSFAKRWIKEALVAEGLLEKIYKNNELTPEVTAAIKTAIAQLENMDKYKV